VVAAPSVVKLTMSLAPSTIVIVPARADTGKKTANPSAAITVLKTLEAGRMLRIPPMVFSHN
jgi:hypothetical protein